MCGLVGLVIKGGTKKVDVESFKQMLLLDTVRGWDSTGIAWMHAEQHWVYKKAIPGIDMVRTKEFKEFIPENSPYLLGHNRWATRGAVNEENAHPFMHGNIILAHNGTLESQHDLPKYFPVDSEAICYSMFKDGVKDTIEKLDGAYALSFVDIKANTFNIVRNSQRPLYYVQSDTQFYYASLGEILSMSVGSFSGKIKELPIHSWFSINLDTLKITKTAITPKPRPKREYYNPNLFNLGVSNLGDRREKLEFDLIQFKPHSNMGNDKNPWGRAYGVVIRNGKLTDDLIEVLGVQKNDLSIPEDDLKHTYFARVNTSSFINGKHAYVGNTLTIEKVKSPNALTLFQADQQHGELELCNWCGEYVEKKEVLIIDAGMAVCKKCRDLTYPD